MLPCAAVMGNKIVCKCQHQFLTAVSLRVLTSSFACEGEETNAEKLPSLG